MHNCFELLIAGGLLHGYTVYGSIRTCTHGSLSLDACSPLSHLLVSGAVRPASGAALMLPSILRTGPSRLRMTLIRHML